ncbi:MAG: putative Ig domain-containing protein [Terracidiphilus sp.]
MFQRKFWWFVVLGLFASVLAATFTGCGGNSPAVGVSVTASASTVDGTDAATLSATVSNDKNAAGVTWTVSGGGTLSNTTTSSATYTAPAATSGSQSITITATSIADTTKSGTATITVAATPAVTSLTTAQQAVAVGTAYSVQLAGSGGVTPYKNWALASGSGSLPSCLSISAAGVLSSPSAPTATCVGVYSGIKFTMTDSGTPNAFSATSSAQTITVTGPVIAFAPTLPQGAVGAAYAGSVAATGALGATTYSLASGVLPADLSLNTSTGAITGTPKAADVGTATFTVSVVDAFGDAATSVSMSITVAAAPAITFGSAPTATATFNVAYASAVTATGGAGSLTYTLASGVLPPDLTLSAAGAIAGTPKAADIGTFTFAVKAADAFGDSATSGNLSIVVSYPAVTITPGTGSLPLAVVGQSYSQTLTAAGGSGAGFTWTVTGLPASGISYSASGATLTINGPATTAGTVNFSASVTDGANNTNTGGALAYSIQVYSPVTIPATIPATLPAVATVNVAYTGTVVATGGSGNYSWTVTGLSDGLTSSTSSGTLTISGTPTSATTVTANVSVKDTTTNVTAGPYAYAITVYATVTLPTTNPSTLGPALVSTPYSGTIVAAGGSGNYSWTVTGLPSDNLNYSASGGTLTISGTPGSTPTTVSFTAKVTDTTTNLSSGPYTYTIGVYNAVTLNASALPTIATVNTAYTGSISASGGSGTGFTWTVTGLPADGLNYSANGGTLTITGTPTSAQVVQFTAKATDSVGNSAGPSNYTITAYNALTLPATNPSTLGPATINQPYTGTVVATGGSGNYSWAVTGLPSDSLNYSTNGGTLTISGTPGTATTVSFTAKVTDTTTNVSVGPFNYSVTVYNTLTLPTPNPASLPSYGTVSTAYSGTISAAGGSGNYSFTVTGLSDNLNYSASGGTLTISGTPSSTATVSFNVTVKDTSTNITAGPYTYTITVYGALSLPSSNPSTLGPATINLSYTGTVVASGGSGNYSWTVTGLPSDSLNFSTNGATLTISGTPGTATTVSFTAKVTDTTTNISVGPFNYSVTVYSGVTLPSPNPATLGPADASSAYSGTIVAAGGSGNYSWTVTGMPADGLNYTASGATLTISGTPTSAQTVQFTAKVTDTTSNQSAGPFTYSIVVNGPLSLPTPDPSSLPANGYTNVSYTGYINASGGSGQYSWTVTGLPSDGLNVSGGTNGSTLTFSGTPTSATTVTFNATLKDTVTNATVTQNGYDITITNPTPVSLPAPSPNPLPSATVNQSYTAGINASGGVSPFTWSINGAPVGSSCYSLGNGTLCATSSGGNTLMLSGTPSTTGTVTLTNVKVTDSVNSSATQTYTITVSPVSTMQITVEKVPQGMVNMPYTFGDLNISGGNGPYTCAYSNAPAGLSLQSGTCNLVGIPTSSGSTTVTLKVTDSSTPVAQQQTTTFTLPVVPETVAAKNSELSGQYACYWEKYWDGGVTGGSGSTLYRGGMVFAFSANGSGSITGGEGDSNSPYSGYHSASSNGVLGGTYAVGSDNRGYLSVAPVGVTPPTIFAIAGGDLDSSSHFSDFAIVEMDDAGAPPTYPSGQHGSGHCYKQNTTGLSGAQPSGGYVWGLRGEDSHGNLEAQVGSGQWTSGSVSGVIDMVDAGTYQGPMNISGTSNTVADAYGRLTQTIGPSGQPSEANPSVFYMTNNSAGEALVMSANPHNAANSADFLIGEARAQNAAHVAASNPLSGPMVMYTSGLDTSLTNYKAQVGRMSATGGIMIENQSGTIRTESIGVGTITVSPTTGRAAIPGQTGDVFYVYDTNSAVVMLADVGNGGGSTTQDELGWTEPQTAPTSGTWAASYLAANYFMSAMSNGDYTQSESSGIFTLNSSGAFTTFALDKGGQGNADWDEPLSGSTSQTATASAVPDTTLDPNGTLGIFDVNATEGGTTDTQVYCVAVSVDKATNSSTQGRLICIDATGQSPQITIIAESD